MNREQMLGSLQRIFVLQYFKTEEIGPYSETIFEQCAWMDGYRFEQACKDVVRTLKTNQRLKPAHFIAAYHRLAEEKGWHTGLVNLCHSCNGHRFYRIWVKDKKGLEFQAAKGCGECNQRYSAVHSDFTEISGPTLEPIDREAPLRRIPVAFAQLLLETADVCKIELRKEQTDALCEAAAGVTPMKALPRRINATKRKNQLVRAMHSTPVTVQEEPEDEASVGSQHADVVEDPISGSPAPQAPEEKFSEEDLADIPF